MTQTVQLEPAADWAGFPGPDVAARRALADVGAMFWTRSWSLGTSSNYSVLLERRPFRLLLTASGKDKRCLGPSDFVIVDETGRLAEPSNERPSAETLLHTTLISAAGAGAVLHTHSVWGTLLSDWYFSAGAVEISGFEMLKGIAGFTDHAASLRVAIFDNTQDIAALARDLTARLQDSERPVRHAFLIRGHGLYTWGRDLAEARRHIEVFEFLFEVIGRSGGRPGAGSP